MSNIVIAGDTSGSVTLQAPAVAGGSVQTFTSASGNITPLVSGTAVTASGTSIDFTGIPSWAKRITVMFSGVSTNGTSLFLVRLGTSGGIATTGYDSTASAGTAAGTFVNTTVGFYITYNVNATTLHKGMATLANISGNTWVESGNTSDSLNGANTGSSGTITLAGTLDRIRITTVNGTDTFDAGTINIMYEG